MFIRQFAWIVGAAIGSSALGAGFAAILANVSPEFIRELTPFPTTAPVHYAIAVGMVVGLFLGAGTMAFCLILTTLQRIVAARSAGADRSS